MDWGVVVREWPTILGACVLTWIVTNYFLGRRHKQDLDHQHKLNDDRVTFLHVKLLYAVQSRLACEIFERDQSSYVSALKSMSADVARLLSEGDAAVKKRIGTLEEEAQQDGLLDGLSMREIVTAKEEFAVWSNENLVSSYLIVATLYHLLRGKPVSDTNLDFAVEKTRERNDANLLWRLKKAKAEYEAFESVLRQLQETDKEVADKASAILSKQRPILYNGSDFRVYDVPHPASWSVGFVFDGPADSGIIEVFVDQKTYTSFYRSDSNFSEKRPMEIAFGTTVTFADRTD